MGMAMIMSRISKSPGLEGLPLKISVAASGGFGAVPQTTPPVSNLAGTPFSLKRKNICMSYRNGDAAREARIPKLSLSFPRL